jgi:hypothetical protein
MSKDTWAKIPGFAGYLINRESTIKYEETGSTVAPVEGDAEKVVVHKSDRHRPVLVPIADLFSLAFGEIAKKLPEKKLKTQYRLEASRKHSGMNGEYATQDEAIERLKRYSDSFPNELIEATITRIK